MDCISWMIATIEQYAGDAKLLHSLICGIVDDGTATALNYQWIYDEKRFCFYLTDKPKKVYITFDKLIVHYSLKNDDELIIRNSDKEYYLSYNNLKENKSTTFLYYIHDTVKPYKNDTLFEDMDDCWEWTDDEWLLWEMINPEYHGF